MKAALMAKYGHDDFFEACNAVVNSLSPADQKLMCFMVDDLGLPACTYRTCKKCN
jgi:hypothetical protein